MRSLEEIPLKVVWCGLELPIEEARKIYQQYVNDAASLMEEANRLKDEGRSFLVTELFRRESEKLSIRASAVLLIIHNAETNAGVAYYAGGSDGYEQGYHACLHGWVKQ